MDKMTPWQVKHALDPKVQVDNIDYVMKNEKIQQSI